MERASSASLIYDAGAPGNLPLAQTGAAFRYRAGDVRPASTPGGAE